MNANRKPLVSLALVLAAMPGCAADNSRYPSLALRPFESGAVAGDTAAPPFAIRAPASADRLTELRAAAAAADAEFAASKDTATRLVRVAAGQPIESPARAAALVELAVLDSLRGRTAGALAALDRLAAEAAGALVHDEPLIVTQAQVAAILAEEDAVLARLWALMDS